jgi:hypothetical protein
MIESLLSRLLAGFWAILGEKGLLDTVYKRESVTRNDWNWVPILLWLEGMVTSMLLINLMSAFRYHLNALQPTKTDPACARAHVTQSQE